MDLSVQKMRPPASVKGKTAAKSIAPGSSSEAVEDVGRDELVQFRHGNTSYDRPDDSDQDHHEVTQDGRKGRRKNRQMVSREDLSELTSSLEVIQNDPPTADGRMSLRAYKTHLTPKKEDQRPQLEINI